MFCCDAKHSNILLVKHRYFTWKGASFSSRKGFIFSWEWRPMEGIALIRGFKRVLGVGVHTHTYTHMHMHMHTYVCTLWETDYNMQWCLYKKIPFQHQKFFQCTPEIIAKVDPGALTHPTTGLPKNNEQHLATKYCLKEFNLRCGAGFQDLSLKPWNVNVLLHRFSFSKEKSETSFDSIVFMVMIYLMLHFFKVVPASFLLVCFVSLKEGTCETGKNVFYFTLKALFVLEIIKF